jgi:hypothetical protein
MAQEDRYYLGSDLKFKIEITAAGFDQATDDYTVDLYCGNKKIAYTRADIVEQAGDYYLLVNTSLLKPGIMKLVITAMVPDNTFASGVRREVEVKTIGVIKSIN